jgi:cell division protein ZapA
MGQVTICVNGRSYRFACGEGEEARISELSMYLSSKLRRLGQDFGRAGDDRLLVMAALMLADEVFEARAELANMTAPAAVNAQRPSDDLRASVPTPAPRTRKPSAG